MMKQEEVAKYLGISSRHLRDLQSNGIIRKPQTRGDLDLKEVIQDWVQYKCNQAVADIESKHRKAGDQIIDEKYQKARKMKLAADKEEIAVKKELRLWAPIDVLRNCVMELGQSVASRCKSIPSKLKLADPNLTNRQIEAANKVISDVLNECSQIDISKHLAGYEISDISGG